MFWKSSRNEEAIAALHDWVYELEQRIKTLEDRAVTVGPLRPSAAEQERRLRAEAAMRRAGL